jgi:hypothetical protein
MGNLHLHPHGARCLLNPEYLPTPALSGSSLTMSSYGLVSE